MTLTGARVLVTGATGRVSFPIARELARSNTVYGAARFKQSGGPDRLADAGIEPLYFDLLTDDVATLPDVEYVFHAGAAVGPAAEVYPSGFETNVHATGRLFSRSRGVKGFVFCSTGSQYAYQGARPLREDDPPGVHLGIYSIAKTAAEALLQYGARELGIPTTIIRIFSTYGPEGGAPADRFDRLIEGKPIALWPDGPNHYNPIYEDDYVRLGIRALEVANVPAVVVNWAGSETVTAEDYLSYLGSLVGIEPKFVYTTEGAYWPLWPDVTYMHEVLGRCEVPWRDGMRRMAAARHPELGLPV